MCAVLTTGGACPSPTAIARTRGWVGVPRWTATNPGVGEACLAPTLAVWHPGLMGGHTVVLGQSCRGGPLCPPAMPQIGGTGTIEATTQAC